MNLRIKGVHRVEQVLRTLLPFVVCGECRYLCLNRGCPEVRETRGYFCDYQDYPDSRIEGHSLVRQFTDREWITHS